MFSKAIYSQLYLSHGENVEATDIEALNEWFEENCIEVILKVDGDADGITFRFIPTDND